jgi:hypothetical protein
MPYMPPEAHEKRAWWLNFLQVFEKGRLKSNSSGIVTHGGYRFISFEAHPAYHALATAIKTRTTVDKCVCEVKFTADWYNFIPRLDGLLRVNEERDRVRALPVSEFMGLSRSRSIDDLIDQRLYDIVENCVDLTDEELEVVRKSDLLTTRDRDRIVREISRRVTRRQVDLARIEAENLERKLQADALEEEAKSMALLRTEADIVQMRYRMIVDRERQRLAQEDAERVQSIIRMRNDINDVSNLRVTRTPTYYVFTSNYGHCVSNDPNHLIEMADAIVASVISHKDDLINDQVKDRDRCIPYMIGAFILGMAALNWELFAASKDDDERDVEANAVKAQEKGRNVRHRGRITPSNKARFSIIQQAVNYKGPCFVQQDLSQIMSKLPPAVQPRYWPTKTGGYVKLDHDITHKCVGDWMGQTFSIPLTILIEISLCSKHYEYPDDVLSLVLYAVTHRVKYDKVNYLHVYGQTPTALLLEQRGSVYHSAWHGKMSMTTRDLLQQSGVYARTATIYNTVKGKKVHGIRFFQLGHGAFRECTGYLPKANNVYVAINVPDRNMQVRLSYELPGYQKAGPFQANWAVIEKIVGKIDVSVVQRRHVLYFSSDSWTVFRIQQGPLLKMQDNIMWVTLMDSTGLLGIRAFCMTNNLRNRKAYPPDLDVSTDLCVIRGGMFQLRGSVFRYPRDEVMKRFVEYERWVVGGLITNPDLEYNL